MWTETREISVLPSKDVRNVGRGKKEVQGKWGNSWYPIAVLKRDGECNL